MIRRLFFGFGVVVAFSAPALAELAMTGAPVAMRAAPSGKAAVVQRVPASAEIEVDKKCPRGWCRASWRNLSGYIPADAVVLGPPPATLPGERDAAAGRLRAADLRHAAGMAMDGRLCRDQLRLRQRSAGRPGPAIDAAPTHERRADLYGGLTP